MPLCAQVTKFYLVLITNEGDIHKNVVGGAPLSMNRVKDYLLFQQNPF